MSKKNHLQDYQLFFMEIPSQATQDLEDIEIIDAAEDSSQPCLNDDQVSQISHDTLGQASSPLPDSARPMGNPRRQQNQLFDN